MNERENEPRLTRRESLLKLGGIAAVVAGAGTFAGRELFDAEDRTLRARAWLPSTPVSSPAC